MADREQTAFGAAQIAVQGVAKNHTGKTIVGSVALITALVNFAPVAFDKLMAKSAANDARIDESFARERNTLQVTLDACRAGREADAIACGAGHQAHTLGLELQIVKFETKFDECTVKLFEVLEERREVAVSGGAPAPAFVREAAEALGELDPWAGVEELEPQ
jgi:hypothetical protein